LLGEVARYQSRGAFGTRDFHKYVFQIAIPEYVATDPKHTELAALGARAEKVASAVSLASTSSFSKARKTIRAALDKDGIAAEIESRVRSLIP
jgi:hypothetical protein